MSEISQPTFEVPENIGGSSAIATPWIEVVQSIDEAQVQSLFASNGEVSPEALRGNGFCYKHDWGNRRGQHILKLNSSAITGRSCVFVSIGEGRAGGVNAGKFVGSARYTLHNVAPRNGGVDIWVNIEWGSNIRIYVDYLIINP